jgi:hypothetical protein
VKRGECRRRKHGQPACQHPSFTPIPNHVSSPVVVDFCQRS